MDRIRPHLVVAVVLAAAAAGSAQTSDPQIGLRENDSTLRAFTHARVVTAPGRVVEDATLVVRDGRVVSVEPGAEPPPGADVTDLTGKTVYPGFLDPYTEYGPAGGTSRPASRRRGRATSPSARGPTRGTTPSIRRSTGSIGSLRTPRLPRRTWSAA